MKPDWKDAPEWAQWLAMDRDGGWFWHETYPYPTGAEWGSDGRVRQALRDPNDWADTRERRP